jgi:hypothetical protein
LCGLQALQEGGVVSDLLRKLPQAERYTYNFEGNSQALDHIYVSPVLRRDSQVDVVHVNSGLVSQTSDHDPITAVVRFNPHLACSVSKCFSLLFAPSLINLKSNIDTSAVLSESCWSWHASFVPQAVASCPIMPLKQHQQGTDHPCLVQLKPNKIPASQAGTTLSCPTQPNPTPNPAPGPGPTPGPGPALGPGPGPGQVPGPSDAWINEVHYDNAGADVGEFVEVAGKPGTDLTGWTVVGYNGIGGANYQTVQLTPLVFQQANGGLGVVVVDFLGLQNGAPDALALVNADGQVIDFVSYEGVITATAGPAIGLTSIDIGVVEVGTEAVGGSVGRTDDGTNPTWAVFATSSRGQLNEGQEAPSA